MDRAMNTEELYDCLTAAMTEARAVGDDEAADEIEAAIETINPFAAGHICTALFEHLRTRNRAGRRFRPSSNPKEDD